ncbi:hypothetical protein BGZ74_004450, partial [Mortierella antarctica]
MNYTGDVWMRIKPNDVEFHPDKEIQQLVPSMVPNNEYDFYNGKPLKDNQWDIYRNYPQNVHLSYQAPVLSSKVSHSKVTWEIDPQLVKVMEQLTHLTHPLDLLVHESLLCYDSDDPLTASIIAFANFVWPQITNIAKSVGAIHQHLEDRDQGLAWAEDE